MSQRQRMQSRQVLGHLGGSSHRAQTLAPVGRRQPANIDHEWDPATAITNADELRFAKAMLKRLRKGTKGCGSIDEEKANRGAQDVIKARIAEWEAAR